MVWRKKEEIDKLLRHKPPFFPLVKKADSVKRCLFFLFYTLLFITSCEKSPSLYKQMFLCYDEGALRLDDE